MSHPSSSLRPRRRVTAGVFVSLVVVVDRTVPSVLLPRPAGDRWEDGSLPVQGDQVCQLARFQLQFVSRERIHL